MAIASASISCPHLVDLPPELAELIDAEGLTIRAATLVTGMAGETMRATYRLECEGGLSVKGRILEDAASATRVAALAAVLAEQCSRVIAQRGRALLEEWVVGSTLAVLPPRSWPLERAGALFADIHRTPPRAPLASARSAQSMHEQLLDDLDRLPSLTGLDPGVARRAAVMVRERQPVGGRVGHVHRDFAAENIVVTPSGRLVAIDNATVAVGFIAEDWGRFWYRWPLAPSQWTRFLNGYRDHQGPLDVLEQQTYWRIAVLARAARFRTELGAPGGAEISARLADLVTKAAPDTGCP